MALALLAFVRLGAGEAAPEKTVLQPSTWRPFKEMQDVLFFESFEHPTSAAEHGKLSAEEPAPPGGHVWKLETNGTESYMQLHLTQTQLKIPQGLNPAQIFIQVSIYSDESGTVQIKCVTQKNEFYFREMAVPKVKGWGVVSVKMGDMKNNSVRPEPEHVLKELEIHVKAPKGKKEAPKAWVDDILVTLNSNPVDVKPRAMIAEKRRLDMEKQLERDGFTYTMAVNDFLKNAVKGFKARIKSKRVLVMGPTAQLTTAWKDQLKLAGPKVKESSFVFDPADDPAEGEHSIGGLDDIRTLLYYNLEKEPQKVPEFAVLAVSAEEALGPGRPSEILRVAILRALESGTVPIICVPGPTKAEEKEKIDNFAKTVEGMCAQLGVPMINGGFGMRNAKGEFDATKAGPQVLEKTALLAMNAIKHVHDSMSKE